MKDGVVTGYIDDHQFKLNSTSKEMSNPSLFLMTFSDVVITQSVFCYKFILFIRNCQIKS